MKILKKRYSLRYDILLLCGILFLCSALGAGAEEKSLESPPDDASLFDMSLEDLMAVEVVSVSNKPEKIWDTPSNITVITDQQIKEWGMRSLQDVLRRVAGYNVVADRDEWSFSARGSISDNNQKYLILIDGHRIYSIDNFGPGNIHELPMDLSMAKRIEIIRGPGSVVWGSAAMAGVINIITKSAEDLGEYGQHTSFTWGEDKTYKTNFQMGRVYEQADADWILMGAYGQSDGHTVTQSAATGDADSTPTTAPTGGFPILDSTIPGATTHPYGAYRTDMGRNDGGHMMHFRGRTGNFHLNLFSFENSVFNRHYESKQGRDNYLTNNKYFVEGLYIDKLDDWDFTWKASYSYNKAEYHNDRGVPIRLEKTWKDQSFNTGISLANQLTERMAFNGGLEYTYTRTGPDDSKVTDFDGTAVSTGGSRFEDNDLFGYALVDYQLLENLMFIGGTGISYNDDRGSDAWFFSPRGGLVWHVTDTMAHKFLYNRAFLRPATFQSSDNPDIDSEEMDQFEYIILNKIGQANLSTTFYYQRLKGFLNIVSLGGSGSQYENAGDYESKGVEMEFTTPLWEDHTVWANASYGCAEADNFPDDLPTNSRRVDTGGDLLSYPNLSFNLGGTFRFYDKKIFLSPAVRYVGSTTYRVLPPDAADATLSTAVYDEVGPFTYLDLNIGYEPTDNLGMYLGFHNLTDIKAKNHLSIWNGTVEQTGRYIEFKLVYKF